ncbi:MAG: HEPN domain-containing protein [Nitrospirota bacterium]
MSAEDRRQNVRLEQEAGTEALSAARALVEKGLYRSAMSRAYYALFHHVRALLYTQGLEPRTHEGLEHLFGLHWVKPGKVDAASAKLLARLQKYREQSDYGTVTIFTKDDVEQELREVERFIATAQPYLNKA